MIRPAALALALLWPLTGHAGEPKPQGLSETAISGITCGDIRMYVDRYGKIAAYAWARWQGLSSKQINEAKRCLK